MAIVISILLDWSQDMRKLIAGTVIVALLSNSTVFAQVAGGTSKPHARHHQYAPLPPHQQPREANAPDNAIGPNAKQKAVDSKINNICRGC
jgi:hypothetical protein